MATDMNRAFLSLEDRTAYRNLEDVVGCKWSAGVVASIARGVKRPGELERFIPGISKKILNERLRKLVEFRLIRRTEFPERVRHVEYELTPMGRKLARVLDQLRELGDEHINPSRVQQNPGRMADDRGA